MPLHRQQMIAALFWKWPENELDYLAGRLRQLEIDFQVENIVALSVVITDKPDVLDPSSIYYEMGLRALLEDIAAAHGFRAVAAMASSVERNPGSILLELVISPSARGSATTGGKRGQRKSLSATRPT